MSFTPDPEQFALTIPATWGGVADLPEDVSSALDQLYAANRVEPRPIKPDVESIKDAAQEVYRLSDAMAAADHFTEAKTRVVSALAKTVVARTRNAAPEVIKAITPAFNDAVAEYTEALDQLPESMDAESLLTHPGALAAYERAKDADRVLIRYDRWITHLAHLGLPRSTEIKQSEWWTELRLMAPTTRAELTTLGYRKDLNVRDLTPQFVIAARESVEFKLNTPQESWELYQRIEQQQVPDTVMTFPKRRLFRG